MIFFANNVTIRECLANLIFGLPSAHWCYVQHIQRGMPLFLYNFQDKTLHGIYTAAGTGTWELNPHGWTPDGAGMTKYPAQVQVEIHLDCPPLQDRQFRPIIEANYFRERGQEKFKQELDKQQAADLCALFRRERQKKYGDRGGEGGTSSSRRQPLASTNAPALQPAAGAAAAPSYSSLAQKRPAANSALLTTEPSKAIRPAQEASTSQAFPSGISSMAPSASASPSASQQQPAVVPQTRTQPQLASSAQPSTIDNNKPGVEMLSDEITDLKSTLGPVIARFRASPITADVTVAQNLRAHIDRLDEALMACQKERSKLILALSGAQEKLSRQNHQGEASNVSAAPAGQLTVAQQTQQPKIHEVVVALGGLNGSTEYILGTEIYSPGMRVWRSGPQLPSRRGYCGVAAVGRHVYMIGGGAGTQQWLKEAIRLDITTGQWETVSSLHSCLIS